MTESVEKSLQQNRGRLYELLNIEKNFDILYKDMTVDGIDVAILFVDGFTDAGIMQRILQYIMELKKEDLKPGAFEKKGIPNVSVDETRSCEQITSSILSGELAFFVDGIDKCFLIDVRTYPARNVQEPFKDRVLRGSRDGFVETMMFNVALLRRRIRDTNFCAESFQVGNRSKCDVALCYISDMADETLVNNLREKLTKLNVEALTMNIQSLSECLLPGKWINPFPKYKYSERPDTTSAALLDGNVVIMVDNSPAAMILPTSVFDLMEEADDFYFPPFVGSYLKLTRLLITFFAIYLIPIWMLAFRYEQYVPDWLRFILITDEITVPIILQLLILELAIDGLKMAAVNTPSTLSTPLSVIAGIVVGEYAISSGWFNGETMLYMAFVTVATYSQVSFEMGYAIKFARVLLLLLSWAFGIFGFVAGTIAIIIMLAVNKTISGKSYIYPLIPFNWSMLKRKVFRVRLSHSEKI